MREYVLTRHAEHGRAAAPCLPDCFASAAPLQRRAHFSERPEAIPVYVKSHAAVLEIKAIRLEQAPGSLSERLA
eukprot:7594945-Pyramimonas_sp.AAC.1